VVSTRLTFHVPQEAEPDKLIPLLEAMYLDDAKFPTVKTLLGFAQAQGLGARTEMQILATACGILETDDDSYIGLSKAGKVIAQLKSDVRPDLIHYLLYVGWQPENPSTNSILWSYREVTNAFWEKPSVNVAQDASVIAEEVRNRSQQVFFGVPGYGSGGVSFSPKSIRGVRKWLEALMPPVIENDTFSRRYFCPPELTLLATGWVAQTMGGEISIDFLLTPERREAICRLCLLDPSALDKVLDWMLPIYPDVIQPGTSAGVYGRFLHFLKWPEMQDLLR
jgi:hypothetical protein